ncbi:hypothetical protein PGQ11_000318 [Apiospora arundinis]
MNLCKGIAHLLPYYWFNMSEYCFSSQSAMLPELDVKGATAELSVGYVRRKLFELADGCSKDLEGDLAQLRALLDLVDQKRQTFQEGKRILLQELRSTLDLLKADASFVDASLSDIEAIPSPPLLSAIPTFSALKLDTPLLTPAASPPESGNVETTRKPQHVEAAGSDAVTDLVNGSKETQGESSKSGMSSKSQEIEKRQDCEAGNVNSSLNPQALVVRREKRTLESPEDAEQEPKKAKTSPTNESTQLVVKEIPRKLRVQDLDAIECVFSHAEMDGFFVIRCDDSDCSLRISDRMPFDDKRAFNHFTTKHFKRPQTEEYIFSEYAYQIEDATADVIAARYDENKIQECSPKNTLHNTKIMPSQSESPRRSSKAVSFDMERSPSLGYQGGGAPSKASDSDNGSGPSDVHEGDSENTTLDQGKARHNLRRLPRLSYTQMVHGRDATSPDSQDQTDDDRTESSIAKRNGTMGSSSMTTRGSKSVRKLLQLGEKPRRSSEQSNKPFGHTGEWARRSAPS